MDILFPCGFVMAEEEDREKGDFFLGILLHIRKMKVLPCPSFLFRGGMFAVHTLATCKTSFEIKERKFIFTSS